MTSGTLDDEAVTLAAHARAFESALDRGPADRAAALDDLEALARRWSVTAETRQAFRNAPGDKERPVSTDEQLGDVAADLDVAEVLLAAGLAAQEVDSPDDGRQLLRSSVERIEGRPSTRRAGEARGPDVSDVPEDSRRTRLVESSASATAEIVDGTLAVLDDARRRLVELAPDVVPKVVAAFESVLEVAPQVGRLIRLGLQAVKRALLSLHDLLPDELRQQVGNRAREWWEACHEAGARALVGRLLSAEEANRAHEKVDIEAVSETALTDVDDALCRLADDFEAVAHAFGRVLGALAAAVAVAAVIAAAVSAVAAWLPLAAAVGYLLAAGSIIFVARDYLDTGGPLARVDGVQRIVGRAGNR